MSKDASAVGSSGILGKGIVNAPKAITALKHFSRYQSVVRDLERRGEKVEVDIVQVDGRNGSEVLTFLHGERPYTAVTLNKVFFTEVNLF